MPLYTFFCPSCKAYFDVIHPYGKKYKCQVCGGKTAKQISAPAGYHITGDNSSSTPPKTKFKKARIV